MMMKLKSKFVGVLIFAFILAGCSQAVESTALPTQVEVVPASKETTSTTDAVDTSLPPTQEPAAVEPKPIEETYFTPPQAEGPYYPVEKPEDRDNDLIDFAGADGIPQGEMIEFSGVVYDADGIPIPNVVIEIWQTDSNGVYLHPGDPGTSNRDQDFQFYGEAVTSEAGGYSFRTILPGRYEPRPRHIHVKIKIDDQEILTTQFYFEGDDDLLDESMFTQTGGEGQHLIISLVEGVDDAGSPIWAGVRDIVLNVQQIP